MSTDARASAVQTSIRRMPAVPLRWPSLRYIAGVVVLAAAYYGAAKLGQTLRYTLRVGLGDLAPGRSRNRGALPLGPSLVAGHLPR